MNSFDGFRLSIHLCIMALWVALAALAVRIVT